MLDECTNRIGVAGQSMLALPDAFDRSKTSAMGDGVCGFGG